MQSHHIHSHAHTQPCPARICPPTTPAPETDANANTGPLPHLSTVLLPLDSVVCNLSSRLMYNVYYSIFCYHTHTKTLTHWYPWVHGYRLRPGHPWVYPSQWRSLELVSMYSKHYGSITSYMLFMTIFLFTYTDCQKVPLYDIYIQLYPNSIHCGAICT
jgi:hypothetical protein